MHIMLIVLTQLSIINYPLCDGKQKKISICNSISPKPITFDLYLYVRVPVSFCRMRKCVCVCANAFRANQREECQFRGVETADVLGSALEVV